MTVPALSDELLKVDEVCAALRKGRAFVYSLITSEALVSVKVGGSRRIRRSDLDAYVASLRPVDPAEIDVAAAS